MTKKEMIERLHDLKNYIGEMLVDAGGDNLEDRRPEHSVFIMSLADIRHMIHLGLIDLFSVGDQIVSKYKKHDCIVWDIIGIGHDKPVSGSSPTLTIQMHYVLPDMHSYSDESDEYPYGYAHYPSSAIRYELNTTFLNGFDAEDRAAMVKIEKVSYTVNDEGRRPEKTSDKLFLLSASEAGFTGADVLPEGEAYEFYVKNPKNREKHDLINTDQPRYWWLRSSYPDYASVALYVNASGEKVSRSAYGALGISAACVIG